MTRTRCGERWMSTTRTDSRPLSRSRFTRTRLAAWTGATASVGAATTATRTGTTSLRARKMVRLQIPRPRLPSRAACGRGGYRADATTRPDTGAGVFVARRLAGSARPIITKQMNVTWKNAKASNVSMPNAKPAIDAVNDAKSQPYGELSRLAAPPTRL